MLSAMFAISTNDLGSNDAPPMSPPSISGCDKSSSALLAFREPPYSSRILSELGVGLDFYTRKKT